MPFQIDRLPSRKDDSANWKLPCMILMTHALPALMHAFSFRVSGDTQSQQDLLMLS